MSRRGLSSGFKLIAFACGFCAALWAWAELTLDTPTAARADAAVVIAAR